MEKGGQKLKTKSVSEMPLNGEVHKEFTVNGHRTVFFHPCNLSLTYGFQPSSSAVESQPAQPIPEARTAARRLAPLSCVTFCDQSILIPAIINLHFNPGKHLNPLLSQFQPLTVCHHSRSCTFLFIMHNAFCQIIRYGSVSSRVVCRP